MVRESSVETLHYHKLAGRHWASYLTFLFLQPSFVRVPLIAEVILRAENVGKALSIIWGLYIEKPQEMVAALL